MTTLSLALSAIAVPLAIWVTLRLRILLGRLKHLREKENRLATAMLSIVVFLGETLTEEQRVILRELAQEVADLQAEITQLNSQL